MKPIPSSADRWKRRFTAVLLAFPLSLSVPAKEIVFDLARGVPANAELGRRGCAPGDLNGDGHLDWVFRWTVADKRTKSKLLAFDHQGRHLWTCDLQSSTYPRSEDENRSFPEFVSPYVIYDVDGDGAGEVYVVDGPNFPLRYAPRTLVKLDGRTGRKLNEVPFPGTGRACVVVGYLDGVHPHLVMMDGYWGSIQVSAIDREMKPVWHFESMSPWHPYWSAGGHAVCCVDLDGDGRDDFLMGSAAIDSRGKPLWSIYGAAFPRESHRRHSDINIVGDILPERPGLEMWVSAPVNDTMGVVDVRTGQWIWKKAAQDLQGPGFVGDIDPASPGMELYAKQGGHDNTPSQLWDAMGNELDRAKYGIPAEVGSTRNWSIWWKGTEHMQVIGVDGPPLAPGRFETMVGDVMGDWREEYCFGGDGRFHIVTADGEPARRRQSLRSDRKYFLQLIRGVRAVGYFERPLPGAPLFQHAAGKPSAQ